MQRRKSRLRHVIAAPACRYFSKSRIYRIYQIAARDKPAISDGVLRTTMQAKAEPKPEQWASQGRLWQATTSGDMASLIHTMRHCSASGAVFFRRSRLFFREAAFFSGGEGCEWGAKQPTVGESGDKAENEFSGFIPLTVPRKGFSPHIPASRLFYLLHPTKSTQNPPKIHPKIQNPNKSIPKPLYI